MRIVCLALWVLGVASCSDSARFDESNASPDGQDISHGCQAIEYADLAYIICAYQPASDDIRLFHSDADGNIYRQFDTLSQSLAEAGETLLFAMNGGMYHEDRRPVGYYRDGFGDRASVNLNDGPGNFHLKPNGVFWLTPSMAGVSESAAYLDAGIEPIYATQSGPMLVYDNRIHPAFNPNGISKKRRNGVGVSAAGDTVYFAISDTAVTFHQFASLFRDYLRTPNALFLDGQVSRIYAPALSRREIGSDLGPIVGVVGRVDD